MWQSAGSLVYYTKVPLIIDIVGVLLVKLSMGDAELPPVPDKKLSKQIKKTERLFTSAEKKIGKSLSKNKKSGGKKGDKPLSPKEVQEKLDELRKIIQGEEPS